MTMIYTTETGFYILKDSDGRIGGKANVPIGDHRVPEWVDLTESFDVSSDDKLDEFKIDPYYLEDQ